MYDWHVIKTSNYVYIIISPPLLKRRVTITIANLKYILNSYTKYRYLWQHRTGLTIS